MWSFENLYLISGSNSVKLATSPSSILFSFIPKTLLFFVKISIDLSVLNKEFKAPKRDSSPVEPNNELTKSVFLLSISIGL